MERPERFGRRGSRPFTLEEMQRMSLRDGRVWTVIDTPPPATRRIPFFCNANSPAVRAV